MGQRSFDLILEGYASDFLFIPGKLKNANFIHFSTGGYMGVWLYGRKSGLKMFVCLGW